MYQSGVVEVVDGRKYYSSEPEKWIIHWSLCCITNDWSFVIRFRDMVRKNSLKLGISLDWMRSL